MNRLSFIKVTQEAVVFLFNNTLFSHNYTFKLIKLFCYFNGIVLPVVNVPNTQLCSFVPPLGGARGDVSLRRGMTTQTIV